MMEDTLHISPSSDTTKDVDHFEEISDAEEVLLERTVWRKLDRWVLPICTIFYLLSFLVSDA
jgi:hypothetical protein